MNITKKIFFLHTFLGFMLFQGCDSIVDAVFGLNSDDELVITATGEESVSDFNSYTIDSGYTVYVTFTGFSNASGTHYRPKVIIREESGPELDSFFGDEEINGEHKESYHTYSTSIEVYAELCQNHNPVYYDTAQIRLTKISVR